MKQEMRKGIIMAILAAVLYAVSSPFSKVLLNENDEIIGAVLFHAASAEMINILSLAINELDCSFKKSETSGNH